MAELKRNADELQELRNQILQFVSEENVLVEEPMSKHTTFRTGGPADLFVKVPDRETLQKLLKFLKSESEPYFVLGNGSNLLVSDAGYRGVVLQMAESFTEIRVDGNRIEAGAGASLAKIASVAREHGLAGLEFASGIPGSLGGALLMNAGAYGSEMRNVTELVEVMTPRGEVRMFSGEGMEFGYRTSFLKGGKSLILSAILRLSPDDGASIQERMDDLNQKRRDKQPLEYPSAGSTFKRPEGQFAGKLIEDAGLKGFTVGGAQVSEKHAGFVINKGEATSRDIYDLIQEVQERVQEETGVELEPEVLFLGEF